MLLLLILYEQLMSNTQLMRWKGAELIFIITKVVLVIIKHIAI